MACDTISRARSDFAVWRNAAFTVRGHEVKLSTRFTVQGFHGIFAGTEGLFIVLTPALSP